MLDCDCYVSWECVFLAFVLLFSPIFLLFFFSFSLLLLLVCVLLVYRFFFSAVLWLLWHVHESRIEMITWNAWYKWKVQKKKEEKKETIDSPSPHNLFVMFLLLSLVCKEEVEVKAESELHRKFNSLRQVTKYIWGVVNAFWKSCICCICESKGLYITFYEWLNWYWNKTRGAFQKVRKLINLELPSGLLNLNCTFSTVVLYLFQLAVIISLVHLVILR